MSHAVLEAIDYLTRNGSVAVWDDRQQRYCHLGSMHDRPGGASGKDIFRVCRNYWAQIDALLQGRLCNHCGAALDQCEQEGEPICFDCCLLEGMTERPQLVKDFIQPASSARHPA